MSRTAGFLLLSRALAKPAALPIWPEGVALAPLAVSDAMAIHRLLQAAYATGFGSVAPDALDWWEALVTDSEFDPDLAFVAKTGETVVGFCLVWTSSFIKDLVVDDAQRRRGVGSALLSTAIHSMRTRGAEHIALKVNTSNEPAQRLYREFGFA